MTDNVSSKKLNLWLESLRCIVRQRRPLMKLFLFLCVIFIPLSLFLEREKLLDQGSIRFITDLFFICACTALLMKYEPISNAAMVGKEKFEIIVIGSLKILLIALPFALIAMVLLNIGFVLQHLGIDVWTPNPLSRALAAFAQLVGIIFFEGILYYTTFRLFQLVVMTLTGIQSPSVVAKNMSRHNWGRLVGNFLIIWIICAVPEEVISIVMNQIMNSAARSNAFGEQAIGFHYYWEWSKFSFEIINSIFLVFFAYTTVRILYGEYINSVKSASVS